MVSFEVSCLRARRSYSCSFRRFVCLVPLRRISSVLTARSWFAGDSGLEITYKLTFAETDSRNGITTLGPLDPGHTLRSAGIESSDGGSHSLRLSRKDGDFYAVPFGFSTQAGETYTVTVRYDVPDALDATTVDGEDYRVVSWAPVQWSLPIDEEIVRFILPVELTAGINTPEQVTDGVVDASGVIADSTSTGNVRSMGILSDAGRGDRRSVSLGVCLQVERSGAVPFRSSVLPANASFRGSPNPGCPEYARSPACKTHACARCGTG